MFIKALRKRGIVLDAAKAAGVDRTTAYRRKEDNADFAAQWSGALEEAADVMEAEAFRRAVKGVRKPVYQGGQLVGYVQDYSDALLTLLLRANRPAKFNSATKVEHTGEIGVLTPEQMEKKRQERLKKVYPALLSLTAERAMGDVAQPARSESSDENPEGAHEA